MIIKFVKVDTTGKIIEQGYSESETLNTDEIIVEDSVSATTHYIVDGVPVPYSAEVAERRKNRPQDPWMIWSILAGDWVDPRAENVRIESQWIKVREQRNSLLAQSDWTTLPDSPLSQEQKQQWIVYRQALRDVTIQPDPFNIVWPTKPGT